MPFNPKTGKAIQIQRTTDDKLEDVKAKVYAKLGTKLSSRNATIDYLATDWLKRNK